MRRLLKKIFPSFTSSTGKILLRIPSEAKESCFLFMANHMPRLSPFDIIRAILLRFAGMKIGRAWVLSPIHIQPIGAAKRIIIGDGSFINRDAYFGSNKATITISENVLIGQRVCFITSNHNLVFIPNKGREIQDLPIIVNEEAWIAAGAIILPGVTIGRGAVVAAGAVVNRDVPEYTLVGGVPAKVIRRISKGDNLFPVELNL